MSTPQEALDYPKHDPKLFVIWGGNRHVWPHAGRRTTYLSAKAKGPLNGAALYTPHPEQAKTFTTQLEASHWLVENRKKRGQAYDGVQITTVAELIARRFPEPKAPTKKAKK